MRVNRAVVGYAIRIALLVLATVLLGLLLDYEPGESSGTPRGLRFRGRTPSRARSSKRFWKRKSGL